MRLTLILTLLSSFSLLSLASPLHESRNRTSNHTRPHPSKTPTPFTTPDIIQTIKPPPLAPPVPYVKVPSYLPLTRHPHPNHPSWHPLLSLHHHLNPNPLHTIPLHDINRGLIWYADVKIGHTTVPLIIDTGSSDLWVPGPGFQCQDIITGTNVSQEACKFGGKEFKGVDPGRGWKEIEGEHLDVFYGDGSFATGATGMVGVELAGISVNQKIALADTAAWAGDGVTKGIMGFAYAALTSVYAGPPGSDLTLDSAETQLTYDPLFTTMYKHNIIAPHFSLVINRPTPNLPDGYLSLGGLPPITGVGEWAYVPLEYAPLGNGYQNTSLAFPQHEFYTFTPDSFIFPGSSNITGANGTNTYQIFLDSGATLSYLPPIIANAVAALYSPPGVWNRTIGGYSLPCDAVAPGSGVEIGGLTFPVDKRDMVVQDYAGTGGCMAGISNGGPYAPYVVGDTFLRNVVVVFDVGAGRLGVRARGDY